MDENMKTGIPPSAEMEDENVSRTDESIDHGETEGADEVLRADPDGTKDQPIEDQENSAHPEGDADGQGEVPEDEPGGAQEADEAEEKASVVEEAVRKLTSWKAANKNPYAQLICDHLIKRCRQDAGFAEDVMKQDKAWHTCFGYIRDKARKEAAGGCACIEDHIVYEWAEDYIRKAEEKKEPGKKSQKPGKNKTKSQEICTKPEENAQSATENAQSEQDPVQDAQEVEQKKPEEKPARAKKAKPKTEPKKPKAEKEKPEKPKKEKKDKSEMDGQIDLFSLFG